MLPFMLLLFQITFNANLESGLIISDKDFIKLNGINR
jgi:hypothetical protein